MAIDKDSVRSFLRKVRDKAKTAVEKKHTELFEAAIDKYLAEKNPELAKGLEMWAEASAKIEEGCTIPKVSKFNPLNDSLKNIRHNIFYGNDYNCTLERSSRLKDDEEVQAVWEAWMTEKKAVETEYNRVFGLIDHAANGTRAMAVLKELGFDVTSLEKWVPPVSPVDKIDKGKLFVCGEKA